MGKVLCFISMSLFMATSAYADSVSLFGVNLGDTRRTYTTWGDRWHPHAEGYVQANVNVPLRNSMFDVYVLSYNYRSWLVEQIYAEATFGSFEQCKSSADRIVESLIPRFGNGFVRFEGANGVNHEYAYNKVLENEVLSVICSIEQGFGTYLWVDLRTFDIDNAMLDSSSNF